MSEVMMRARAPVRRTPPPPSERQAAILALWDRGMSQGQIARKLGISQQRVSQVVTKLRPALEPAI